MGFLIRHSLNIIRCQMGIAQKTISVRPTEYNARDAMAAALKVRGWSVVMATN